MATTEKEIDKLLFLCTNVCLSVALKTVTPGQMITLKYFFLYIYTELPLGQ